MVSAQLFGTWLDGTSVRLREVLGELEGVSPETLERIDRVSRPSGDGPVAHNPKDVMLYDRLVLLALAEAEHHRQKQGRLEKAASTRS